jgi:hypothetical protein
MKQRSRNLILSAIAVAAVACSDGAGPSELASAIGDDPRTSADVPKGDLRIRGVVLRYSGGSDTSHDTLGTLVAVPNALVEAYWFGPVSDSVIDTIPDDSIQGDTVHSDTAHVDSIGRVDTLMLGRWAASQADTSGNPGSAPPRKAAQARTDAMGMFSLDKLARGVYRVDVTPAGSREVRAWTFVELRDSAWVRFTLPPR